MTRLVLLSYNFIFDPSETWSRMSEFESSLADYFKQRGLQAETVTPLGITTAKVVMITKIKEVVPPVKPAIQPVKKDIKSLQNPKNYR